MRSNLAPRRPYRVSRRMALETGVDHPALDAGGPDTSLIADGPVVDCALARLQRRFGLPQCHGHQPAGPLLTQVVSSEEARNRLQEVSQGSRAPFVVVVQNGCLVKGGDAGDAHWTARKNTDAASSQRLSGRRSGGGPRRAGRTASAWPYPGSRGASSRR